MASADTRGATEASPEDGGDLGAGRGAEQRGERHADQRQHALQLLHHAREELIGEHAEDGGHQHHLKCAQSQALHGNTVLSAPHTAMGVASWEASLVTGCSHLCQAHTAGQPAECAPLPAPCVGRLVCPGSSWEMRCLAFVPWLTCLYVGCFHEVVRGRNTPKTIWKVCDLSIFL